MNLRNMNIGDANAVKLDKIGELTLYVPWCKTIEKYYKKHIGSVSLIFRLTNQHMRYTIYQIIKFPF